MAYQISLVCFDVVLSMYHCQYLWARYQSTSVITDQSLYCSSALCIFLKSMINNPEFCQFILQVQSGVIYFYNLIIFFRNPTVQNLSQFHSLVSSQKTAMEMDAPRF